MYIYAHTYIHTHIKHIYSVSLGVLNYLLNTKTLKQQNETTFELERGFNYCQQLLFVTLFEVRYSLIYSKENKKNIFSQLLCTPQLL